MKDLINKLIENSKIKDKEYIVKTKTWYSIEDKVSCTADEVYERYGLSMFDNRELKFEDYK